MLWWKKWFSKKNRKEQSEITKVAGSLPSKHVLTLQIDKSGKIQTNLPTEVAETVNGHTIAQICKVMGYIAMLEMQSPSRTLH